MTTPIFRTTCRIEFADTDMAGIVHFANFFRFMESAEVQFLHTRGLSVAMKWQGQSIGFPRVSASCDYLKPARFEDVLNVDVLVQKVGRTSITYAFEFSKDEEIIARGRISCVCCLVQADRKLLSMEIPEEIRQKLI
jgi:YbgC/YbaW family acyl-CoA thioester hydrolase